MDNPIMKIIIEYKNNKKRLNSIKIIKIKALLRNKSNWWNLFLV